jgi:hypothetical protein
MEMIIVPSMCKIFEYYSIPSEKCSSEQLKIVDENVSKERVG